MKLLIKFSRYIRPELLLIANFMTGTCDKFTTALIVTLVLGLLNFIKPILVILTLPSNF
jgi:uncharacterized membrane protein YvlD (DUF360 family)